MAKRRRKPRSPMPDERLPLRWACRVAGLVVLGLAARWWVVETPAERVDRIERRVARMEGRD